MAFALLPSVVKSHFEVLMEHFDNPDQFQDAIKCSEQCTDLLKFPATSLSEVSHDTIIKIVYSQEQFRMD